MATTIEVSVDAARALAFMRNGEKRTRYAIVNALNDTAKRVQAAEREQVGRSFTLRKRDFVERQVAVIKPFASVSQSLLETTISVGEKPRLLLSTFEAGGVRKPFTPGAKDVAVPFTGTARPSFASQVPDELQLRRLQLKRGGRGRGSAARRRAGVGPIQGLQHTYVVPKVGVLQRTGPRKGQTRILYPYVHDPRLKPSLHYVALARLVIDREFEASMRREIAAVFAYQAARGA